MQKSPIINKLKNSLIWLIPLILYLLSSQFSSINTDGVRDYLAAYDIAINNNYPLIGPQMAFTFHIGPLWFYILSLPMILIQSWSGIAFIVALINSFKFYLIFKIGKRLLNKEFAIILVACLMLSSFTLLQQWSFTHSNLIEVSILLVLYYSLRLKKDSLFSYVILGLLTGLALHAHPTTAIVGYWLLLSLFTGRNFIGNGFFILLGIIIVFSPILVHQFSSGYEDLKATSAYFSHHTGNYDIKAFFKLIYGGIFHTAHMMYKTVFPEVIATVLYVIHYLFILITITLGSILLIQSNQFKKVFLQLFGFFIFTLLFLFFIRNNTPWYMTYAFTLSFSLLMALFVYIIHNKYQFTALPFYYISAIIMSFMVYSLSLKLNTSIKLAEASMNNIRTLDNKLGNSRFEFPAYLATEHGKLSCKNRPVTLNGPYAAMIYSHSGIEHLAECGTDGLYYGHSATMNTLFAVPHYFKELINKHPIKRIGNSYFYQPLSIYSGNKLNQEKFINDYERSINRIKDWESVSKVAHINKGSYLVITKQMGFFMQINISKVSANNQTLTPISEYDYAFLYHCEACDEDTTQWIIEYSESITEMTNIVSF